MAVLRCAILLLALTGSAESLSVSQQANPIRRVVTMLQNMQKKVEAEGEKEEALFNKFMCYCKNGKGALEASVEAAKGKNDALAASIKETTASLAQTKADLKSAQESRAAAKAAQAKATALREKEAGVFAKDSGDFKTNIAAMKKATAAIEKGAGGAFLQTSTASVLKQLSVTMDMSSVDREMLTSFLSGEAGYAPASGSITGILKQMTDTMEADLKEITDAENASIKDFDGLMAAKTKEVNALTKEIESKTASVGELGVQLVTEKEDLDDTTKSLGEDEQFLKDLERDCKTKDDEWATRCKIRSEELLALADTIKILNDDDALELFKKTLPAPSLMQLTTSSQMLKARALGALEQNIKGDFRLNLISMALKGKKVSFTKVLAMIDDMTALLKKEQVDDDDKKAYCEQLIDTTEDKVKELELSVSDLAKAIADAKEGVATFAEELEALADGIKALDQQVAEATEQRKEEHADNTETLANDNAAKEIIGIAKNRMNKFYAPKLYKAPAAGEEALAQVAPPPPPETFGAYAKKGGESGGVIAMMDTMVADLDKEMTEIEVEEKEGQKEYEQFMADSAEKRANDAKSIEDKESAKADMEAKLLRDKEEKTVTTKEAMATHQFLADVHGDCDWLLSNYENRKNARAGEIDALAKGKAVLSGADFSLLQKTEVHRHQ
jgi:septal ring factor EnvC (AmiA/AmiB activator)